MSDRTEMIQVGTPTQVAHTARTMVRTIVQSAVGAGVAWLAAHGIDIAQYAEAIVGIIWVVATALTTWVMNQPSVNAFIDKWLPFIGTGVAQETGKAQPLGDAPLSAPADEDDEPVVVIVPDIEEQP